MSINFHKSNFNAQGFKQAVRIAKRDNNLKRSYLIVNTLQAKHIPVFPGNTLELFSCLGEKLTEKYSGEKVLIVGFAETATAIGTAVASSFAENNENIRYVHTTREDIRNSEKIVDFSEDHSHATEQKLYFNRWDIINVDRIIFIEDEITTGKTIINFITALRTSNRIKPETKFSIGAIINNTKNASYLSNFSEIEFSYLYKINQENFCPDLNDDNINGTWIEPVNISCNRPFHIIDLKGKLDTRSGVLIKEYNQACDILCENIINKFDFTEKNVLVLGTEEFMYPAIQVAQRISILSKSVSVHSTTRSPIVPINVEGYPIKFRYEIVSPYSDDRRTFIYNLEKYDKVIIMTDSEKEDISKFCVSITSALNSVNCLDISFIRWVK